MDIKNHNSSKANLKYMGESSSNLLMRNIDSLLMVFYRLLPFTYIGMFRNSFGETIKSTSEIKVLDLGCGDGSFIQNLNLPKNFKITGVDIHESYLELANKKHIYHELIKSDISKFRPKNKFDIVIASHVLEHFDKNYGNKFIKFLEKTATKRVVIACPIGHLTQGAYDDNKYQIHKSEWSPRELELLGYCVKSQGLKLLWGEKNVVQEYGIMSYFLFIISILAFPLLKIRKDLGTYMICYKVIN